MAHEQTVFLAGSTGRTGGRVLRQLVDRGVRVRVVVRSIAKLPPSVVASPNVTVTEASLLSLSDEELQRQLRGCDAVISCLGHVISFKGIFGPPRDLVTRATQRLCRAIEAVHAPTPTKFILMSSVSVNRPHRLDTRRTWFERAFLRLLGVLVPPARDNQRAADFLDQQIGTDNACVEWVVVRPDALLEGEVSEYAVHEGLVDSLFSPGATNMANVAHFMSELVTNPKIWSEWKHKQPVIANVPSRRTAAS